MERKLIDMHMHTCYSDGELTPDELIEYAISRNVGTMAITRKIMVIKLIYTME